MKTAILALALVACILGAEASTGGAPYCIEATNTGTTAVTTCQPMCDTMCNGGSAGSTNLGGGGSITTQNGNQVYNPEGTNTVTITPPAGLLGGVWRGGTYYVRAEDAGAIIADVYAPSTDFRVRGTSPNTFITHMNGNDKTSLTFKFTGPAQATGNIEVVASFIGDKNGGDCGTWYTGSFVLTEGNVGTLEPTTTGPPTTTADPNGDGVDSLNTDAAVSISSTMTMVVAAAAAVIAVFFM